MMEKALKSENDITSCRRENLFHVHSAYSDGIPTIEQWFEVASKKQIKRITFLEHVRRNPNYDIFDYFCEVERRSEQFNIEGLHGFEAKLLPSGELDLPLDFFGNNLDILGIAEHSFPFDYKLYKQAWFTAIGYCRYSYPELQLVWVHPGLWLKKHGLLTKLWDEYIAMITYAIESGVYIEHNLRYDLVPEEIEDIIPERKLIIGLDGHDLTDLNIWDLYFA